MFHESLTIEQQDMIKRLSAFFAARSEAYELEMVFLYGSWAGGYPREASDIDIAVLFRNGELPEEEAFNRVITMESELSQRLNREVNILLLSWDFQKPLLYYNAIVQGTLIYAKDFERYIALSIEALFQMEDYSLFGIPWQIEVAQNNLEAFKNV
jgi:predicted nucleotidyltransferase